jgi:hypothetical protein
VTGGDNQILEVVMHGRRRHARFSFSKSDGVLTVLRDVVVQTADTGELVVLDVEPRQQGELLTLETIVDHSVVAIPVKVITSRPIVRSGQVQHELVMRRLEENR